jgi:hypothetical protein
MQLTGLVKFYLVVVSCIFIVHMRWTGLTRQGACAAEPWFAVTGGALFAAPAAMYFVYTRNVSHRVPLDLLIRVSLSIKANLLLQESTTLMATGRCVRLNSWRNPRYDWRDSLPRYFCSPLLPRSAQVPAALTSSSL